MTDYEWHSPKVSALNGSIITYTYHVLQCVAVCCGVLQCVAVCCSVLQINHYIHISRVAVCCSVLQINHYIHISRVAVCCSVLQCVAVCCRSIITYTYHAHLHENSNSNRLSVQGLKWRVWGLHDTATHCNSLQYTAPHCTILHHTLNKDGILGFKIRV